MKSSINRLLLVVLFSCTFLISCTTKNSSEVKDERPLVLTTFTILKDIEVTLLEIDWLLNQ